MGVCKAGAALLVLLPLLPLRAAAPPPAACARLADKYAHRYQILLKEPNTFRAVVIEGTTAPMTVWGARRGPAAAAAALLYAALHYGLGYDAVLERRPFDDCSANKSRFSVAPVAVRCGTAEAALGAPLLARAAAACARRGTGALLRPSDAQRCHFMTLTHFKELFSELNLSTHCDVRTVPCSPAVAAASSAVVLVAAEEQPTDSLKQFLCNISSISLAIVSFDNTSCFHDTLQKLYEDDRNLSFLYVNQDLSMYQSDVLTMKLYNDTNEETAGRFNFILGSNRAFLVGTDLYKYTLQIADIVDRFDPQLKDLKDVLNNNSKNDIEAAACDWAINNSYTFESWITSNQKYKLYVYLCISDSLNDEYKKTLSHVKNLNEQEYKYEIVYLTIDCNSPSYMQNKLINILNNRYDSGRIIGVIAWSSSAGSSMVSKLANDYQIPFALVGPVAADVEVGSGRIMAAVNGRLEDLANAYYRFLKKCNWSRLVILSDESPYAKFFKNYLLKAGGIVQIEKILNLETITNTLRALEKDYPRIFIVNTNSMLASKILQSASQLDLTPVKGYVWIVREWSPIKEFMSEVEWGSMSLFSLSWAWRGAGEHAGGRAELRAALRALWPRRTWPALAVPLVDAMLLLCQSFAKFNLLYSSNPYRLLKSGYAMKFSEIYEKISVKGVARDISIKNSFVEDLIIYVEQWNSTTRTVLATWRLQGQTFEEGNETACTLAVPDRPSCLLRGGDATDFVQKCYDPLLYTSLAIFILLPGVFIMARRARLRRLKRRDLKMLANLFEKKQSNSIVNQDSLYLHKEIGTGNFGRVYLATLRRRRRRSQEKSILVAAKALRNESDKREFLQEARILEFLEHKNIVKFVGICVANGLRFILMEYALYGDLHYYLKSRRHLAEQRHLGTSDESEAVHVSTEALTRLASEAAAALEYLAQEGLVHRDVRAANCVVDKQRTLKLADFGMARKLCHDQQEYTTIRQALFPVLWMAPESLIYGTFSTSSDVWALGMLFFELATLGQRPYGDWSPQRVLEFVRLGGRPPLPPDMWPQTRSLLMACWQQEPAARPGAAELARFLAREPRAVRAALLPAPSPPPPAPRVGSTGAGSFIADI